ncbi:MAG: DUF420 domain-containing protein [Acidobacteriota bacterium]
MSLVEVLPTWNTACNAVAVAAIVTGWRAVRAGNVDRHRKAMLAALGASTLFLAGYLTRYYLVGTTRFVGEPLIRGTYLVLLYSHMVLAVVALPLVLRTFWLALKDRIDEHRRLVRFTLPIWLYVSVTGLVVHLMLHYLSQHAR